jgi:hypothetical protein
MSSLAKRRGESCDYGVTTPVTGGAKGIGRGVSSPIFCRRPDNSALRQAGVRGLRAPYRVDHAGASGFKDRVNNRYVRIFGSAFLLSAIGAGLQIRAGYRFNVFVNRDLLMPGPYASS